MKSEFLKKIPYPFLAVSAEKNINVAELKEEIFQKLNLIRVYTRSRFEAADKNAPLIVKAGTTVLEAAEKLHRDLRKSFKHARIWGPSAKHPGQRVGGDHVLKDGDEFIAEAR